MACIDKLDCTVLISTECVPTKQGKFYLFVSFMSFLFGVLIEGCDLPCHPVGKLHDIIFCPWSLVIIGKITL